MSEGDVSLIRDEDVLRRMWQQTEDFSRKKEIRAHMYRLREERLRNLYSPEPGAEGKGCEFTSTQGHVKSFADQSFQSMKRKEVRDAGSPPKEFSYSGQDLKELSNAGWNVESENRTTDDGHTHVKSMHANIEGRYDVEGGRGQFAAVDQHKQAVTEYDDGNTSLKRNESASNTAAQEQVVRNTDDGTQFSSTASSSTSTSKFQQISSHNESVPYVVDNDYDVSRKSTRDNNYNEEGTTRRITRTNDYEHNLRSDYEHGEVVSRKVEYPDDNTKIVVETRRLPDGTKVTSTRREFRAPVVQSSRSEEHSQQRKSDIKTSSVTSTQKRSHTNELSSKISQETIDVNTSNIVDTQRVMDDYDFKKKSQIDNTFYKNDENLTSSAVRTNYEKSENKSKDVNRHEITSSHNNQTIHRNVKESQVLKENEDRIYNVSRESKRDELIERKISSDQYQTTYQADFTQKKISNDWSPSHQAWASTLRSDTSPRPSVVPTRDSSPGSKTFRSSNSSLRSSISPDKTYKKPPSRGGSPNKIDRYSPTRTISDRYSSTHSTHSVTEIKSNVYTSPDRKPVHARSPTRPSYSPDRRSDDYDRSRPSVSSDRKNENYDKTDRSNSPVKPRDRQTNKSTSTRFTPSPDRNTDKSRPSDHFTRSSPDRSTTGKDIPERKPENDRRESSPSKPASNDKSSPEDKFSQKKQRSESPDKTPNYMRPTAASKPKSPTDKENSPSSVDKLEEKSPKPHKTNQSPERKQHESNATKIKEQHYKFIDEETKMYTRTDKQFTKTTSTSSLPKGSKSLADHTIVSDLEPFIPKTCPTLVKQSPSPDSPTSGEKEYKIGLEQPENPKLRHKSPSPDKFTSRQSVSPTRKSPVKDFPIGHSEKPLSTNEIDNNRTSNRNSPTRGYSPAKKSTNQESPAFKHDSRSPSPRSSLRKDSSSPNRVDYGVSSAKQTSEKVTSTSVRTESLKTTSRNSSVSPDKYYVRESSPTKQATNRPNSPLKGRILKSPVPQNYSSRESSPTKKYPSENVPKKITDDDSKLKKDVHVPKKNEKDTSPARKEPIKMVADSSQSDFKSSLPTRKSPSKDSDILNRSPPISRKTSRSPSPHKSQLRDTRFDTYEKNKKTDSRTTETIKSDISTETVKKEYRRSSITDEFNATTRERSPSKYGTYDKSQQIHDQAKTIDTDKDLKMKSSKEPVSPTKHTPTSVTSINTTAQNISNKTVKYQQSTDFLNVERKVEEKTKNIITKERPKQLVTPSTSPTRKPKGTETEPSTGQSSPTTSASGFVYYSSPRLDEAVVTDLDDQEFDSENSVEEATVNIDTKSNRSKSPTKIPCRSPSPEKRPVKESLPRKSSLKKPSVESSQVSPTEKPPSSFSVSPMVESKEFFEKPESKTEPLSKPLPKAKPPLERRETYEERCRKILGMSDELISEQVTITNEDLSVFKKSDLNISSPSVSPCRSPAPCDDTSTVTDFLERERADAKTKPALSRDSSPSKQTSIIINSNNKSQVDSREESIVNTLEQNEIEIKKKISVKTNNKQSPRQSPDRKPKDQSSTKRPHSMPNPSQFNTSTENYPKVNQPDYLDQHPEHSVPRDDNESATTPLSEKPKAPITSSPKQKIKGQQPAAIDVTNEPVTPTSNKTLPIKSSQTKQEKTSHTTTNIGVTNEYVLNQTTEIIPENTATEVIEDKFETPRSSVSPTRKIPKVTEVSSNSTKDSKNIKKTGTMMETKNYTKEFITVERNQELEQLDNEDLSDVHVSDKTTEIKSEQKFVTDNVVETTKKVYKDDITHKDKTNFDKKPEPKVSSKPPSRNVSPVKRTPNSKPESPESPSKIRSISPKKPAVERPQSPQIPKISNIKTRDQIPSHIRKPSPSPTSPTRIDKIIEKNTLEAKKTVYNTAIKQNSFSKVTLNRTPSKSNPSAVHKTVEQDIKQLPTPKSINKENMNPKKDIETRVVRTTSDITLKIKKIPSQRIKSRPEIQVSDMSTTRLVKQTTAPTKGQKPQTKEPQIKFPTSKPKSATALNTSTDDDDVIIDVQQAKSSRENSPDRICPTPVGFQEDVGTPRFPDEVNEPDDEFNRRSYHTIHEAESIVDDIVEICEDDELFVKRTDLDYTDDNYFININEKVSKIHTKKDPINKLKDTSSQFKDVEKKVHSDFDKEDIKSDECLLSVSEKVNKFAKGPRNTKDNRSPSRNIKEEYDKNTIYQDDYTKLSVNDKAHLFVETAENVKLSKPKPSQKIERPDFSEIDDSLKSDDCLLSVSDKVNKFVKTAEQFLNETHEIEEKERKIKEEHDKIMKKIVNDTEDETSIIKRVENVYDKHLDENQRREVLAKDAPASKYKEPANPNPKSTDRNAAVKITTLRSSEAVKKAKALFENIASSTTNKTKELQPKTTKLTDIGVFSKSPKTDSTIALHPSLEDNTDKGADIDFEKASQKTVPKDYSAQNITNYDKRQVSVHDNDEKSSAVRIRASSPETSRTKSPLRQVTETISSTKTVLSRYPVLERAESPKQARSDTDKPDKILDKIPGYLRPTKTSQIKEEPKTPEVTDTEVSSRRGSGKFGVELRRTSVERSTVSSERRRSSVEHHQPCIEDIFDLDLLEQMLEKVVGYEQRRRIRAQIRIAKKKSESDQVDSITYSRSPKLTTTRITKVKSPERLPTRSPEGRAKPSPHKTFSPERQPKSTPQKIITENQGRPQRTSPERFEAKESPKLIPNGHGKEASKTVLDNRQRPHSPEKPILKSIPKSPVRQASPEKRSRPLSPTKTATPKSKGSRFNEYASAYMKKVGLNESDKLKFSESKTKKVTEDKNRRVTEHRAVLSRQVAIESKHVSERTTSKDNVQIIHLNGKRSPSPEKNTSPARKAQSPERSPQQKPHSPERKPHIPEHSSHSPSRKQQTPNFRSQGPDRKPHSPERKTHSLDRKPHSPELKPHSPHRMPHSPERKQHSPERKPHSPDRKPHSPERKPHSPDRKPHSPERIPQSADRMRQPPDHELRSSERKHKSPERTATPELKHQKSDVTSKKEVIVKTTYDAVKKIPQKQQHEEKPSWVTNRNLKKITSETRTFSTKKMDAEKPKYRAPSPSKIISKPIDVITSSYGPGPLDADGKPLFGIKALRNGATNYQVKGTVIRQEFHSRNGSEPEGTVSVTAYSTEPEDLERLLQCQGERPSRLHGLAAITTTKKFGGDTGTTLGEAHGKNERAALDQFTHSDRRVVESRTEIGSESLERREQKHSQKERIEILDVSDVDKKDSSSRSGRRERLDRSDNETASTHQSDWRQKDKVESKRTESTERREEKRGTERMEKSERSERTERRVEDRKTVRQSSVKSLTEKFIKSASESARSERSAYPKAGLILRTATMKDSVSSDSSAHAGLTRTDSEHSLGSVEDNVVTTTTEQLGDGVRTTTTTTTRSHSHSHGQGPAPGAGPAKRTPGGQERSFLDSTTKVTGVQDILTRMKNADIVIEEGDSSADAEARALLNKFLGATVLMAGMQSYVVDRPATATSTSTSVHHQETVQSSGGKVSSSRRVEEVDLEQCWDERVLRSLLDECSDYEQRRRLRARLRTLMAEQEACASAVTDALAAAGEAGEGGEAEEAGGGERGEEEVTTVTSSTRRNSSDKTVSSSTTTTTTTIQNSKVIESMTRPAPKPVSPFAKFRQLEKQNSTTTPSSPKTPQSPGSPSQPYFKFTDPALQASAVTIKERLLQWCRDKTRDYENVKLENFSTSWADGLAFCALLHHFLPDAFDYAALTPDKRRHNFTLAFKIADEKAGIYPLLDVDDMVAMRKPDWKCVFTYVQSIYRRFREQQ